MVDEDEAAGQNIVGVGAGGGLARHSSGTGLQPCRAGTGELTCHRKTQRVTREILIGTRRTLLMCMSLRMIQV